MNPKQLERNNVILAINPSHSHWREQVFWENLALNIKTRGWELVEIATRALPLTENCISISLPARLADINRKLRDLKIFDQDNVNNWLSDHYIHILEDWEHRRWNVKKRSPAILMGLLRMVSFVDRVIRLINPSAIMTTNKIDNSTAMFREAALYYGIDAYVIERSPLDSIMLEPKGIFAESLIWEKYKKNIEVSNDILKLGKKEIETMIKNPYGFRPVKFKGKNEIIDLKRQKKPVFFLPMDNVLWTGWEQPEHPMNAVDNPLYKNPGEAIGDIVRKVRDLNGILAVKKHPADLYMDKISLPHDVLYLDGDLTCLLKYSDVVITFLTKLAYNAVSMGKPVVTLAPNPVACSGATYHCLRQDNVFETLKKALNRANLKEKLKNYPAFIGWLASKFFYQIEDNHELNYKGPGEMADHLIDSCTAGVTTLKAEKFDDLMTQIKKLALYDPARSRIPAPSKSQNPMVRFMKNLESRGVINTGKRFLKKHVIAKTIPAKAPQYNPARIKAVDNLKESEYESFNKYWRGFNLKESFWSAEDNSPPYV